MRWFRMVALGLLGLLPLIGAGQNANAQASIDYRYDFPPVFSETPMGVNIQTGRFRYQPFNFSVGPFALQRGFNNAGFPFLGSLHVAGLQTVGGSQTTAFITIGESQLQFYPNSTSGGATSFLSWNATAQGWILSWNGSVYTLTDKTGAVYTFTPIPGYNGGSYALPKAKPTSVIYADDHRIDISYDANAEPIMLKSNLGYAVRYERTSGGAQVKMCGFNLAETYVTTTTPCTGALQVITANYLIVSADYKPLQSFLDIEGRTSTVTYTPNSLLKCVTFPDSSTCEFDNAYGPQPGELAELTKPDQVRRQTQPDGQQWTYQYDFPIRGDDDPPFYPGDPRLHYSYAWGNGPGGISFHADFERGLATGIQMTGQPYLQLAYSGIAVNKITYLEGNSIAILRDHIGNAVKITEKAKPGSGDPDRVTEQSFPYAPAYASPYLCDAVSLKLCDKPIWRKDPLGNQTDFTYDAAHGGVLTETGPAVNGVRPQKRYSYVQRNAMVKNASGSFVAMQPPVWLLASERYCKTSAASGAGCVAANDIVIKTYEYGPTTGANNLLLRGTVDDAGGPTPIRTCYTYDAAGNRISETRPATGTSCP